MMTNADSRRRTLKLVGMLSGLYVLGLNGCSGAQEFRAVAGDSLKSGLTTIATGVIDGLFAAFEPDSTTN